MWPGLDKGESLSPYVARAVRIIKESGLAYHFGPMGTSIEGEWEDAVGVVERCFQELKKDCNRIVIHLKADYRKDASDRLEGKVASVKEKLKQ